jgi:hypothetical protein
MAVSSPGQAHRSGKRLTVAVPAELVEPLERLARQEDRSVSAQIVNIVRQYLQSDEALLRDAIERARRGEVTTLPEGGLEAARRAIKSGAPTDDVMSALIRGE